MRQLKNFMKAKKPMWNCGECKCITLQCWRENDEFCNCGENVTPPVPPVPPTPTTHTVFFDEDPSDGGSVSMQSIEVEDWTTTLVENNAITFLPMGTTITATPSDGYIFGGWSNAIPVIEWNTTITAIFSQIVPVESITAPEENAIQITEWGTGYIRFGYSPTNATLPGVDINYNCSDDSIANINGTDYDEGNFALMVHWASQWTCTITYSLGGDSYTVDVEVIPGL